MLCPPLLEEKSSRPKLESIELFFNLLKVYGMKKLLLLALSACFMTVVAVAQEQKDTKQYDPKEWDNKVKTELKLTQDQIVKYDAWAKNLATRSMLWKKMPA